MNDAPRPPQVSQDKAPLFPVYPNGGTVYVKPTDEEPWSGYRKLNAGLEQLVATLETQPRLGDSLMRSLDKTLASARTQARELADLAKTVETAAMMRVLEYFRTTSLQDELARSAATPPALDALTRVHGELRHLLGQLEKS